MQPQRLIEHVLGGNNGLGDEVEAALRPHLDWADVVFVDGWAAPAGLLSSVDPGTTRVIVRLHGVEIHTAWPHVTDLSRVDDIVFATDRSARRRDRDPAAPDRADAYLGDPRRDGPLRGRPPEFRLGPGRPWRHRDELGRA